MFNQYFVIDAKKGETIAEHLNKDEAVKLAETNLNWISYPHLTNLYFKKGEGYVSIY